jgi:hypothetical protein
MGINYYTMIEQAVVVDSQSVSHSSVTQTTRGGDAGIGSPASESKKGQTEG